ncbi:hypothetical protein ACTID9_02880 [Brevibacillus fluminis]|uniref:hypothetical protein n=1 Tax=Brevibacillus fluminis TaxID=511487 RepID=UPI003F895737
MTKHANNLMRLIMYLIMLLILTNCSSKETQKHVYSFYGESQHWSAELSVDAIEEFSKGDVGTNYNSEQTRKFTVTYKGDLSELSNIKKIEYSYQVEGVGGGAYQDDFASPPTQKVFTFESSDKGGAIIGENQVVKATVIVDGVKENLELTIKKNK